MEAKQARERQLEEWYKREKNRVDATPKPRAITLKFPEDVMLLSSVIAGNEEEVVRLLENNPDINTNAANPDGLTPLHQAAIDSRDSLITRLLRHGANINVQDNEGWTPLHAAASGGDVHTCRLLLEFGADVTVLNADNETALDCALNEEELDTTIQEELSTLFQNHLQKKGLSLDYLEKIKLQERRDLLDAAHDIVHSNNLDQLNDRDDRGATMLHVAACQGYDEVTEYLINNGADVNIADNQGITSLHAAVIWGHINSTLSLVRAGANLHAKTNSGEGLLDLVLEDDPKMKTLVKSLVMQKPSLSSSFQRSPDRTLVSSSSTSFSSPPPPPSIMMVEEEEEDAWSSVTTKESPVTPTDTSSDHESSTKEEFEHSHDTDSDTTIKEHTVHVDRELQNFAEDVSDGSFVLSTDSPLSERPSLDHDDLNKEEKDSTIKEDPLIEEQVHVSIPLPPSPREHIEAMKETGNQLAAVQESKQIEMDEGKNNEDKQQTITVEPRNGKWEHEGNVASTKTSNEDNLIAININDTNTSESGQGERYALELLHGDENSSDRERRGTFSSVTSSVYSDSSEVTSILAQEQLRHLPTDVQQALLAPRLSPKLRRSMIPRADTERREILGFIDKLKERHTLLSSAPEKVTSPRLMRRYNTSLSHFHCDCGDETSKPTPIPRIESDSAMEPHSLYRQSIDFSPPSSPTIEASSGSETDDEESEYDKKMILASSHKRHKHEVVIEETDDNVTASDSELPSWDANEELSVLSNSGFSQHVAFQVKGRSYQEKYHAAKNELKAVVKSFAKYKRTMDRKHDEERNLVQYITLLVEAEEEHMARIQRAIPKFGSTLESASREELVDRIFALQKQNEILAEELLRERGIRSTGVLSAPSSRNTSSSKTVEATSSRLSRHHRSRDILREKMRRRSSPLSSSQVSVAKPLERKASGGKRRRLPSATLAQEILKDKVGQSVSNDEDEIATTPSSIQDDVFSVQSMDESPMRNNEDIKNNRNDDDVGDAVGDDVGDDNGSEEEDNFSVTSSENDPDATIIARPRSSSLHGRDSSLIVSRRQRSRSSAGRNSVDYSFDDENNDNSDDGDDGGEDANRAGAKEGVKVGTTTNEEEQANVVMRKQKKMHKKQHEEGEHSRGRGSKEYEASSQRFSRLDPNRRTKPKTHRKKQMHGSRNSSRNSHSIEPAILYRASSISPTSLGTASGTTNNNTAQTLTKVSRSSSALFPESIHDLQPISHTSPDAFEGRKAASRKSSAPAVLMLDSRNKGDDNDFNIRNHHHVSNLDNVQRSSSPKVARKSASAVRMIKHALNRTRRGSPGLLSPMESPSSTRRTTIM